MVLIFLSLGIFGLSGIISLFLGRNPRQATMIGAGGAVLGSLAGLIPAMEVLWTGQGEMFRQDWQIPFGSFYIHLDALSAFFLTPIFGLSIVTAVYGGSYMKSYWLNKNLGASWFFFNMLSASMALVVIAHNGVMFLLAWEIMSLSSFFLVTFEDEKESVRRAGWIYLAAAHLGTAFLFVLFLVLARKSGSLDFDGFAGSLSSSMAGVAFVLALIGFGAKAGFAPFHVWLPEAHPAAPSHVSALMSGVMIKTGIYGILRTLTFLGRPEAWWGWTLIMIGLTSGVLGVLFALAQHDLKRLLAYHSVENIGIIALGLGLGVLGLALDQPVLAVLGLAGGMLHILNHAIFKALLFLGAGAVLHATGTRHLEHMGGLLKRMPWTAAMFVIGAVAIAGLPPLNGFVSEFLIYLSAFRNIGQPGSLIWCSMAIAGLALIGGLAAACFTKAFGIVFLGEPRGEQAEHGHEVGRAMLQPMAFLALGCLMIGLAGPGVFSALQPVIGSITGFTRAGVITALEPATAPLIHIAAFSFGFLLIMGLLTWLRRGLLKGKSITQSSTWGCGYLKPSARMQYTASSFARPITDMFRYILMTRREERPVEGLFPTGASLKTETDDLFLRRLFAPLFRSTEKLLLGLRIIQQGRVQYYILYMAGTLLILLIWNLW